MRRGYKDPELMKIEEELDITLEKSVEKRPSLNSTVRSPRRKKNKADNKYIKTIEEENQELKEKLAFEVSMNETLKQRINESDILQDMTSFPNT